MTFSRLLMSACLMVFLFILQIDLGLANSPGTNATRLSEVVVTATRFLTPQKNVPGRIEVISAKEIERTPFERIDELLQHVSGVQTDRNRTPSRWGGL